VKRGVTGEIREQPGDLSVDFKQGVFRALHEKKLGGAERRDTAG